MEGVEYFCLVVCLPVCLTGALAFLLAGVAFLVCVTDFCFVTLRVVFLVCAGKERASTHASIIKNGLFIYIFNNLPRMSFASTFLYLLETVVFTSHFSVVFTCPSKIANKSSS